MIRKLYIKLFYQVWPSKDWVCKRCDSDLYYKKYDGRPWEGHHCFNCGESDMGLIMRLFPGTKYFRFKRKGDA